MTIKIVKQELKDFKEIYKIDIKEIKETLKDIYSQTKTTNGRVIAVETIQGECPARDFFKKGAISRNLWQMVFAIIAVVSLFIAYKK